MRSELIGYILVAVVATACGKKAADVTVDAVTGILEDAIGMAGAATPEAADATPAAADVTATGAEQ